MARDSMVNKVISQESTETTSNKSFVEKGIFNIKFWKCQLWDVFYKMNK
jgi:hypothetical protein